MELAPSGVPLSFEVTFDSPSLDVGMKVFDDTGSVPVPVTGGVVAMLHVYGNTYRAKFTGEEDKSYIIIKSVYTDNTFTDLDTDYAAGSESIVVQDLTPSSSSCDCSVVGFVVC